MNLDRVYEFLMAQARLANKRARAATEPSVIQHELLIADICIILAGATLEASVPPGTSWNLTDWSQVERAAKHQARVTEVTVEATKEFKS